LGAEVAVHGAAVPRLGQQGLQRSTAAPFEPFLSVGGGGGAMALWPLLEETG
jgi:hypothetical protein